MNCKKHSLEMKVKHMLPVEGGTKYEYECPQGCKEIITEWDSP